MTKKRAVWLGETMRLDIRLISFLGGEHWVRSTITRHVLLHASEDEVIARFFVPALAALKKAQRRPPPWVITKKRSRPKRGAE